VRDESVSLTGWSGTQMLSCWVLIRLARPQGAELRYSVAENVSVGRALLTPGGDLADIVIAIIIILRYIA